MRVQQGGTGGSELIEARGGSLIDACVMDCVGEDTLRPHVWGGSTRDT